MKNQQIYQINTLRFFKQNFFIFVVIFGHLLMLSILAPRLIEAKSIFNFIFYLVFLPGLISIPSFIILLNYCRHSFNKKISISNIEVEVFNKSDNRAIKIKFSDIKRIIYVSNNDSLSRFPWLFHEYVLIFQEDLKPIVLTSYSMNISSFLTDNFLLKSFDAKKLVIREEIFPIIKVKAADISFEQRW